MNNSKLLESNWGEIKFLIRTQVYKKLNKYGKLHMLDEAVDHVLFCVVREFSRYDSSKCAVKTWVYRLSNYRTIDFIKKETAYSKVLKQSFYKHVNFEDLTNYEIKKLTIFNTNLKFEDQNFAVFIWDKFLPNILTSKEIKMLRYRYLYNMTFISIGKRLGFGESRASQYHAKILKTIRQAVQQDKSLKMELLR